MYFLNSLYKFWYRLEDKQLQPNKALRKGDRTSAKNFYFYSGFIFEAWDFPCLPQKRCPQFVSIGNVACCKQTGQDISV